MIVLPRQAGGTDTGETSQQTVLFSCTAATLRSCSTRSAVTSVARQASRNASFETIYIYKRSFCQDRLGKNIGKHSKTDRFLAGDLDDHTTHAMWLGEPFAMKVERMSNNGKRTHLISSV
jgi:hypothetical protein